MHASWNLVLNQLLAEDLLRMGSSNSCDWKTSLPHAGKNKFPFGGGFFVSDVKKVKQLVCPTFLSFVLLSHCLCLPLPVQILVTLSMAERCTTLFTDTKFQYGRTIDECCLSIFLKSFSCFLFRTHNWFAN